MKKHYIEEIPSIIRQYIPQEENVANVLMDILSIGKESVYRRLRGEISFTFDEIACISLHLGFSIDNIIGMKNARHALVGLDLLNNPNHIDNYLKKIESQARIIHSMKKAKKCKVSFALNNIPHILSLKYENLSNFNLYKWHYQICNMHPNFAFSDFKVPKEINIARKKLCKELQSTPYFDIIVDSTVLSEIISDLNYFYKRNLISTEELEAIKKDLLHLVSSLEAYATAGNNGKGAEILLYLSSVNIDTTYCHFEYDNKAYSYIQLFSISSMDTTDQRLCQQYKYWINSLKRYSLNITQSAETQRFDFFIKQKEHIMLAGEKKDTD